MIREVVLQPEKIVKGLIVHADTSAKGIYDHVFSRFPGLRKEVDLETWSALCSSVIIGVAFAEISSSFNVGDAERVSEAVRDELDRSVPGMWDEGVCAIIHIMIEEKDNPSHSLPLRFGQWLLHGLSLNPDGYAYGILSDPSLFIAIGTMIISHGHNYWSKS